MYHLSEEVFLKEVLVQPGRVEGAAGSVDKAAYAILLGLWCVAYTRLQAC